ncbi:MAG: hypothetical protein R3C12_06430 [Planctomycetaceae bacterium]
MDSGTQDARTLVPRLADFRDIPKTGYVGVGLVREPSVMVKDFKSEVDGRMVPLLDCPLVGKELGNNRDNAELSNYAVRVEWIKAVPRDDLLGKGLFAIQHTACKMRSQFTIEKLSKHFGLEE